MPALPQNSPRLPTWSVLEDQFREQTATSSSSSRSMTDELFGTPPATKRKRVNNDTPPSERARPVKKSKSTVSNDANTSLVTSNTKRPVQKNAKAGPSTQKKPVPVLTPTRISSPVSRPTLKKTVALTSRKKAVPVVDLHDSDSDPDRTPPFGILRSSNPQTPSISPTKNVATSKRQVVHLGAIELSSDSEDDARSRSPKKRVKTANKLPPVSEIINLCSDDDEPPKPAVLPTKVAPTLPRKPDPQKKAAAPTQKHPLPQKPALPRKSASPKKATPPKKADPTKQVDPPKQANPLRKGPATKKTIPSRKATPIHEDVVILSSDDEAQSSALSKQGSAIITPQGIPPTPPDNGGVDVQDASANAQIPEITYLSDDPQLAVDSIGSPMPISSSEPTTNLDSTKPASPDETALYSLQASYHDAMEEQTSKPRKNRISAFSSSTFSAPPRIITFSDMLPTATLHTPIYFSRSLSSINGSGASKKKGTTTKTGSIKNPQFPISSDDSLLVFAEASRSVVDEDSQSILVPQPRLPFSFPAETSPFDQTKSELWPMDETVSGDPLPPLFAVPEDSIPEAPDHSVFTHQEIAGPLAVAVEGSDSATVSRGDLNLSNLPVDHSNEHLTMAEVSAPPAEESGDVMTGNSIVSNDAADHLYKEPSPGNEEVAPPCESRHVGHESALSSKDDANPSPSNDPLSSHDNVQREFGHLEMVDSAAFLEPSEHLTTNEECVLSCKPAVEQAADSVPLIPKELKMSSVRLLNALQGMMASKKAGNPSMSMAIISSSLSEIKLPLPDKPADAPANAGESVPPATLADSCQNPGVGPDEPPLSTTLVDASCHIAGETVPPSILVDSGQNAGVDNDQPLEPSSSSLKSSPSSIGEPQRVTPGIVAEKEVSSIPDISPPFAEQLHPTADSHPSTTLDDRAKLAPAPLPASPGSQISAARSLASLDESPSPVTPLSRRGTEPLIWSNSQSAGISILDITTSDISIQLLMSSSKYEEDEDDDTFLSDLELAYPEEVF